MLIVFEWENNQWSFGPTPMLIVLDPFLELALLPSHHCQREAVAAEQHTSFTNLRASPRLGQAETRAVLQGYG